MNALAPVAVCGVTRSILGRPWRWRGLAANADEGAPDALVERLLLTRGCPRDALDLHRRPTLRGFLPDPSIFRDMDTAAARVADAVGAGEAIAVFGDYDVDGATSAALLIRLLRMLGASPRAYIPDRLTEGYGPSGAALRRLAGEGARLVITVDCGAQAFEALADARAAGLDVVVVDHHQCATALPPAVAVVNANRLDECAEGSAHGHLAAVGMAFLLGVAVVRELRRRGYFAGGGEPDLLALLDLVALGTVADVASLRGLNRAFVTQGLRVLARGGNAGLAALAAAAGLRRPPTCTDLGFALGPRINAGGRVGRADLGVRLLVTDDADEAAALAAELDQLNRERRAIEATVQDEAATQASTQDNRAVILVAGVGWHPGVIGIVAGRLKERFGRPALVVALDGGVGKGSGRSIPGVDLGAAVLAAKDQGHLVAGGGHAMAAGLTVAAERVAALHECLETRLAAAVARSREDRALMLDAVLAPGGVTPDLVDALDAGGPYGAGWPAPRVAAGPVRLVRAEPVGDGHIRAVAAGVDGRTVKAVAFRHAATPLGQELLSAGPGRRLWLAGRARRDDWNGRATAELHLDDAAWADG